MLVALMLVTTNSFAYHEDPHQQFDMTSNMTNNVTISFIQTKNVQATCDLESRKRGGKGFGMSVEACSFWDRTMSGPDSCVIVTSTTANFHTIGHEVRHCIQGNFHK